MKLKHIFCFVLLLSLSFPVFASKIKDLQIPDRISIFPVEESKKRDWENAIYDNFNLGYWRALFTLKVYGREELKTIVSEKFDLSMDGLPEILFYDNIPNVDIYFSFVLKNLTLYCHYNPKEVESIPGSRMDDLTCLDEKRGIRFKAKYL